MSPAASTLPGTYVLRRYSLNEQMNEYIVPFLNESTDISTNTKFTWATGLA